MLTLQIFISAKGGWREEPFTECSEICSTGNSTGIKRQLKYCDSPRPQGGNLCPCNETNPYEKECNGLYAVIEEPCVESPCQGKLFQFLISCHWLTYKKIRYMITLTRQILDFRQMFVLMLKCRPRKEGAISAGLLEPATMIGRMEVIMSILKPAVSALLLRAGCIH